MRIVPGSIGALRAWWFGSTLLALAGCAPLLEEQEDVLAIHRDAVVDPSTIRPERELFINDISVVDDPFYTTWDPRKSSSDPAGSWSFGRLIDNMVPETMRTPLGRSQFILAWLKTWEQQQTVNGLIIPARPLVRSLIIDPWRAASGCVDTDERCTLDLVKAPFRLLAVVNRPDLRRLPTSTDPGNAGQGRFVFGVLGASGERLPFTVIFEYQLPIAYKVDMLTWANRWHALGSVPFGSTYNAKLQAVTYEFAKRNAAPGRVNGSALLQIRTNEVPLSPVEPKLWELREFVLNSLGQLRPATVKQEVDASLNGSALLGAWAAQNAQAILAGQHEVPALWGGRRFLAAAAPVPADLAWVVPGVDENVRHAYAYATCSGCHKSETGTSFLHVRTRDAGAPAGISAFLAAELSPTGPRVADFVGLLNTTNVAALKNGSGRDHPEHPSSQP